MVYCRVSQLSLHAGSPKITVRIQEAPAYENVHGSEKVASGERN